MLQLKWKNRSCRFCKACQYTPVNICLFAEVVWEIYQNKTFFHPEFPKQLTDIQRARQMLLEQEENEKDRKLVARLEEKKRKHEEMMNKRAVKRQREEHRRQQIDNLNQQLNAHVDGECDYIDPNSGNKCRNHRNLKRCDNDSWLCKMHRIDEDDEEKRWTKRRRLRLTNQ